VKNENQIRHSRTLLSGPYVAAVSFVPPKSKGRGCPT
jgi:hypothetical protein